MDRRSRDLRFVEHLPDDFLLCRTIRHIWHQEQFRVATAEEMETVRKPASVDQVIVRRLQCLRCGTNRNDYYGRRKPSQFMNFFRKFKTTYSYPPKYLFNRITKDRPISDDFQWESYQRASKA